MPVTFHRTPKLAADPPPGDGQQFEQQLAQLAYMQLRDQAPKLCEYIVGFQLIDRTRDKKKAVGVFGLKAGDVWMYAPCFFVGGELKGELLLYVKNWDLFVPRTDEWVGHLIGRRPSQLGKADRPEGKPPRQGAPELARSMQPFDVRLAADARGLEKAAAAWCRTDIGLAAGDPAAQLLARVATAPAKLAAALHRVDIAARCQDPGYAAAAVSLAAARPAVKLAFDRFLGADFLPRLFHHAVEAAAIRRAAPVKLAAAPGPVPALRVLVPDVAHARAVLADAPAAVRQALTPKLAGLLDPGVSDADRDAARGAGYGLVDARTKTAAAYETRVLHEWQGPDRTGVYRLLTQGGQVRECLILLGQQALGTGRPPATVIPLDAPGTFANVWPTDLYCVPQAEDRGAVPAALRTLDTADRPGDEHGRYVVVGPTGDSTCPFTVYADRGDGVYAVCFDDRPSRNDAGSVHDPLDRSRRDGGWDARLVFTGRPGERIALAAHDRAVLVPDGYKCVKLSGGDRPGAVIPGKPEDVDRAARGVRKLACTRLADGRVQVDDPAVGVRGWAARPALAVAYLATGPGLSKQAAEALVAAAGVRSAECLVKAADALTPDGFSAPVIPEQLETPVTYGYSTQATEVGPESYELPLEGNAGRLATPQDYDPFYQPDPAAADEAARAADSGHQEVFEVGVLGAMAKSLARRPVSNNDVGDLVRGMDRYGRLLFLLYYHPEKFAERYGKDDVKKLEETLEGAFEAAGHVTLFLKEKTTEARSAVDLAGVGLPDLPGTDA